MSCIRRDAIPGERLVCIPEASERLAVSERTVWKLLKEGSLTRVRLGRATRIRWSELERVMRQGVSTEDLMTRRGQD